MLSNVECMTIVDGNNDDNDNDDNNNCRYSIIEYDDDGDDYEEIDDCQGT